jgi:hypothetical protein
MNVFPLLSYDKPHSLDHDIKNLKEWKNSNNRLKVKWEKVDIDLYKALTDQSIDALSKTTRTLHYSHFYRMMV